MYASVFPGSVIISGLVIGSCRLLLGKQFTKNFFSKILHFLRTEMKIFILHMWILNKELVQDNYKNKATSTIR